MKTRIGATDEDMGLWDGFRVVVGGTETSQEKADQMGADGWATNPVEAVRLWRSLMGRQRERASGSNRLRKRVRP